VREDPAINIYFPDFEADEIPPKKYFYGVSDWAYNYRF